MSSNSFNKATESRIESKYWFLSSWSVSSPIRFYHPFPALNEKKICKIRSKKTWIFCVYFEKCLKQSSTNKKRQRVFNYREKIHGFPVKAKFQRLRVPAEKLENDAVDFLAPAIVNKDGVFFYLYSYANYAIQRGIWRWFLQRCWTVVNLLSEIITVLDFMSSSPLIDFLFLAEVSFVCDVGVERSPELWVIFLREFWCFGFVRRAAKKR